MLIAKEKKSDNMAEYILYMWQVEDILRAMRLDIRRVEEHVVAGFDVDEGTRREVYDWYDNLIEMMKKERVEQKGHLQIVRNNVNELTELHYHLLHNLHDGRYRRLVSLAAVNLAELRGRSAGVEEEVSDVELALNGLYGYLLLKLQGKEVAPGTVRAMESFGKMLAYLAAVYKRNETATDEGVRL